MRCYANGDRNSAARLSSAPISNKRLYFAMRSLRLAERGIASADPVQKFLKNAPSVPSPSIILGNLRALGVRSLP